MEIEMRALPTGKRSASKLAARRRLSANRLEATCARVEKKGRLMYETELESFD